jgi:hypothetical protein
MLIHDTGIKINKAIRRRHLCFDVIDTENFQTAFRQLGEKNDMYAWTKAEYIEYSVTNEKVFQLDFPGSYILENEGTRTKVLVDGLLVGYLKAKDARQVAGHLERGEVVGGRIDIIGGRYRYLESDYDWITRKDTYTFDNGQDDFEAEIVVIVTEESTDVVSQKLIGYDSGNDSPKGEIASFEVEVVGTQYYEGESILRNVIKDQGGVWDVGGYQEHAIELFLSPEPTNKYDSGAIRVDSKYPTPEKARTSRSGVIGYLPKGSAPGITDVKRARAIVREGYGKFWVKIDLS